MADEPGRSGTGHDIETMLVTRQPGSVRPGRCPSCLIDGPLTHGMLVSSHGQPLGAVELCAECGPRGDRLLTEIGQLLSSSE